MGRWDWLWKWGVGALALGLLGVLAYPVVLYTDRTYYCENTGSRYGYRVWWNGARARDWFKASPLERYLEAEAPGRLRNQWHPISSAGKNFLGQTVMRGCGPAGGTLFLKPEIAQDWIDRSDKADVLAFYDALLAGDMQADGALVFGIMDDVAADP